MNKSRRMKEVGQVAYMGEIRNTYKILVEKPNGKTAQMQAQMTG
jgi:hypothetical protein